MNKQIKESVCHRGRGEIRRPRQQLIHFLLKRRSLLIQKHLEHRDTSCLLSHEDVCQVNEHKHDTHFRRGHDLVRLLLVQVFYRLSKNSRVGVRQVSQRLIAGAVQLLRSRLHTKQNHVM